jgi:hypothetical protein
MKYLIFSKISLAFLLCTVHINSHAIEGGYSNYIPGFYGDLTLAVEPDKGLSLRNDIYSYHAEGDSSVRSGLLELDIEVDLNFNYLSLVNKLGIEIFGAQYAYGATFVLGNVELDGNLAVGSLSQPFNDDKTSYGDITLVPAIFYWNNGDKLHYSHSFWAVAPVGDYDKDDLANTGLNYWTFGTDFAMTYLNNETGQDYSLVVGYAYNMENNDTNYQSGDEAHVDYVINQFVSESLAVGIHGFYYRQISGDSGKGALLGDFKAKASGIGPALMWIPPLYNDNVALVAKWIHEYDSENRLDGDHVYLSFMLSF